MRSAAGLSWHHAELFSARTNLDQPESLCQENGQRVPSRKSKGVSVASPWNEKHFKVQHDSVPLEREQANQFHTVTMQ